MTVVAGSECEHFGFSSEGGPSLSTHVCLSAYNLGMLRRDAYTSIPWREIDRYRHCADYHVSSNTVPLSILKYYT